MWWCARPSGWRCRSQSTRSPATVNHLTLLRWKPHAWRAEALRLPNRRPWCALRSCTACCAPAAQWPSLTSTTRQTTRWWMPRRWVGSACGALCCAEHIARVDRTVLGGSRTLRRRCIAPLAGCTPPARVAGLLPGEPGGAPCAAAGGGRGVRVSGRWRRHWRGAWLPARAVPAD